MDLLKCFQRLVKINHMNPLEDVIIDIDQRGELRLITLAVMRRVCFTQDSFDFYQGTIK